MGLILGRSQSDGEIYIAEHMDTGFRVCTYRDFRSRYEQNGKIIVEPNDGDLENLQVAKWAIKELIEGGKVVYNLVTNNGECFVNRAMHVNSVSTQVINTALGFWHWLG